MNDTGDSILQKRYDLAIGRIRELREEKSIEAPWRDYFQKTAAFIVYMDGIR